RDLEAEVEIEEGRQQGGRLAGLPERSVHRALRGRRPSQRVLPAWRQGRKQKTASSGGGRRDAVVGDPGPPLAPGRGLVVRTPLCVRPVLRRNMRASRRRVWVLRREDAPGSVGNAAQSGAWSVVHRRQRISYAGAGPRWYQAAAGEHDQSPNQCIVCTKMVRIGARRTSSGASSYRPPSCDNGADRRPLLPAHAVKQDAGSRLAPG